MFLCSELTVFFRCSTTEDDFQASLVVNSPPSAYQDRGNYRYADPRIGRLKNVTINPISR